MRTQLIKVYMDRQSGVSDKAHYALSILLDAIGVPFVLSDISDADLVYSAHKPKDMSINAVFLQSVQIKNWDGINPQVHWEIDIPWIGGLTKLGDARGDILYSTYALVTGSFETQDGKDQWGVPLGKGGTLEKLGLLDQPWVLRYCEILREKLCTAKKCETLGIPLWPDNKKYAIVLSHDVDAPISYLDTDFRKLWLQKLARERRFLELPRAFAGFVEIAFKKFRKIAPMPKNDPNFAFDAWIEFQAKLQSKSAFYVAPVTSAGLYSDDRDVNYCFNRPEMISAMMKAIDAGWEIGLHPSINAWRDPARVWEEKKLLQSCLGGYKITGVRHHFWALDDQVPERTIRYHAEAGFKYDSSLGLNDAAGFRRGIAFPFQPFDKETSEPLAILEIPPTLMDGGVFYNDVSHEEGVNEIVAHIKNTAEHGGAVVLNWHLEQMNSSRLNGAGPALVEALIKVSSDSEIFWASPSEMCEWWAKRRELIKASI